MKTLQKPWLTALLGALLMMSLGVAEAAEARTPSTNAASSMAGSDDKKHRHPQGSPGKSPHRYLEHKADPRHVAEPAARSTPGETPYILCSGPSATGKTGGQFPKQRRCGPRR